MIPSPAVDKEHWLLEQKSIVTDLFTQATGELQSAGIRILTGSCPPVLDATSDSPRIYLTPLRYSNPDNGPALELNLAATTRGGPARYTITLQIHGPQGIEALRNLSRNNPDWWQKLYVGRGLWLNDGKETQILNDLSKITNYASDKLQLTAVLLHSEWNRAIQRGIKVMGLLYRSVLDELSGASKLSNLATLLMDLLDGHPPQFERYIRP